MTSLASQLSSLKQQHIASSAALDPNAFSSATSSSSVRSRKSLLHANPGRVRSEQILRDAQSKLTELRNTLGAAFDTSGWEELFSDVSADCEPEMMTPDELNALHRRISLCLTHLSALLTHGTAAPIFLIEWLIRNFSLHITQPLELLRATLHCCAHNSSGTSEGGAALFTKVLQLLDFSHVSAASGNCVTAGTTLTSDFAAAFKHYAIAGKPVSLDDLAVLVLRHPTLCRVVCFDWLHRTLELVVKSATTRNKNRKNDGNVNDDATFEEDDAADDDATARIESAITLYMRPHFYFVFALCSALCRKLSGSSGSAPAKRLHPVISCLCDVMLSGLRGHRLPNGGGRLHFAEFRALSQMLLLKLLCAAFSVALSPQLRSEALQLATKHVPAGSELRNLQYLARLLNLGLVKRDELKPLEHRIRRLSSRCDDDCAIAEELRDKLLGVSRAAPANMKKSKNPRDDDDNDDATPPTQKRGDNQMTAQSLLNQLVTSRGGEFTWMRRFWGGELLEIKGKKKSRKTSKSGKTAGDAGDDDAIQRDPITQCHAQQHAQFSAILALQRKRVAAPPTSNKSDDAITAEQTAQLRNPQALRTLNELFGRFIASSSLSTSTASSMMQQNQRKRKLNEHANCEAESRVLVCASQLMRYVITACTTEELEAEAATLLRHLIRVVAARFDVIAASDQLDDDENEADEDDDATSHRPTRLHPAIACQRDRLLSSRLLHDAIEALLLVLHAHSLALVMDATSLSRLLICMRRDVIGLLRAFIRHEEADKVRVVLLHFASRTHRPAAANDAITCDQPQFVCDSSESVALLSRLIDCALPAFLTATSSSATFAAGNDAIAALKAATLNAACCAATGAAAAPVNDAIICKRRALIGSLFRAAALHTTLPHHRRLAFFCAICSAILKRVSRHQCDADHAEVGDGVASSRCNRSALVGLYLAVMIACRVGDTQTEERGSGDARDWVRSFVVPLLRNVLPPSSCATNQEAQHYSVITHLIRIVFAASFEKLRNHERKAAAIQQPQQQETESDEEEEEEERQQQQQQDWSCAIGIELSRHIRKSRHAAQSKNSAQLCRDVLSLVSAYLSNTARSASGANEMRQCLTRLCDAEPKYSELIRACLESLDAQLINK